MTLRSPGRSSVAVQLWGTVVTAGVLLTGLILLNTHADQGRERARAGDELGAQALQLATFLAGEVTPGNDTEQTLAQIAAGPELAQGGAECVRTLEALQSAVEIGYLEVVDADGRVLCTPTASHRSTGSPWSEADALLGLIRSGDAGTDGPVQDPWTDAPSLFSAVPVDSDPPSSLVFVAESQDMLSPDDTGDEVEVLAVDVRSGTVLMRSPERDGVVGSTLPGGPLSASLVSEDLTTADGVDGVRRLYTSAALGDTSYRLLVGEEEAEVFAAARADLRRNLLLGGVLILVVAGLGLLLQRRIGRPARRLRAAIEAAGRGGTAHAPVDGPSELAAIGVAFNDMLDARIDYEQVLSHRALHDPLTDLPNRTKVTAELATRIAEGAGCAALFVDLDRFKLINDAHGHAVGDQVLVALAEQLLGVVRPGDLVGRFGGDEFVVVVSGVKDGAEATELADRVRSALTRPLLVGQRELFVSGSVGIAVHAPGEDAEAVLRNADTAMYRAKAHGRNCAAVFDEEMREEAQRLLRIENDLHRALEREQLRLVYQPVVDVSDGRVVGVEALVRWDHPARGLVPPGDFIAVAEETGLIVPIGAWVLREACSWAAREGERLHRPVAVAVNVSPHQVAASDFVDLVADVLATTGLAPQLLTVEVTESVLVQEPEVATAALEVLRSYGVRVAIDDFGTGWSSLTYLQTLPVDEIKLDRSYVSRVPGDGTASAIVSSLIGMARTLGLDLVAEGVETEAQLAFLQRQGCDKAQGYLFAQPLTPEQLRDLLAHGQIDLPTARAGS